ncbi:FAD-dependent pyridine nucleotide-disulfide oxidoreductase [Calothrix parasitica NIES-267]|uniref:NADH:ubiquinone reductase (non-electrogenic) n=1 Tax=Calothrix parasitica NIES-267 TaxID=1973488 RepID=A0A1Z4LRX6_9CYAN|nr:FAD-dependent pyridine nucleotide-disulfide oxidoreductase [Calothrix parasitica NIES-267]
MENKAGTKPPHHVVIVGGGFGGLYTAKALNSKDINVTLIDKRNFHLFQPLLYQVATGTLSPADISSPLRSVLNKSKNTKVLLGEVSDIDPEKQNVMMGGEKIPYDSLIIATGAKHSYFGKDEWEEYAPGLKTVEDAIEMRRRIFMAFEAAEQETDEEKRRALLTFVVVGGGPTGVELAGAIAELAYGILKEDFRNIDTSETQVMLLEGMDRVLPPFAPELSAKAQKSLEDLGVSVVTKTLVTGIEGDIVTIKQGDESKQFGARTVLWAAGVKASPLGKAIAEKTGSETDRAGRVIVEPDLSLKGYPNIYVIGDLAHFAHQTGRPLPGVAPVAMQEGQYVAKSIKQQLKGNTIPPFQYFDKGSLAVIGQHAAVVDLGFMKLTGFVAWLFWLLIHVYYLVEFDNKLVVMIQWVWNYFTRNRGARLITGKDLPAPVEVNSKPDYYPAVNNNKTVNV